MKFCTKCGNEVKEEQTFCTSCGNGLENESTNKTLPTEETKPIEKVNSTEEYVTPNINLTKKSKIAIAVVTVLILAIVAIVQVGNYLSNPKKLEARFQRDVVSSNTSDLASILYCNDARITVDSKSIAPLLDYFKKNPSYYDEVIQNLNNDALSPKDISNLNITSSNTLTLTNVGKKFLVFPNYKINIKPSFVAITTTVKDVTFSINNIQIGKSDTDKSTKEFGPYIPGTYSILANYKGKYVTLSKPYPVNLIASSDGIAKLSVFDDINYINITSDYPDAKIFVNSKDTNVKVKDATNFGPIDSSSKIYATNVIAGKALKSEDYSATSGETEINISFEDAITALNDVQTKLDEVKSQLSYLLSNYTSYFTEAVNENNFSLINSYVTFGSELYKQQQSYIPATYTAGIQESIVSANIINYNISDDNQSGSITTSEVYTITKDGTSSNKNFEYVYKFQYNVDTSSYQFTQIAKYNN